MHQLIEIWSAKPAWAALSADDQRSFIDRVLSDVSPLMATGLRPIGAGFVRAELPNSLPYQYFAVWEAPEPALLREFTRAIQDAGWFEFFDQLNVAGEAISLTNVLAHHVSAA